MTRWSTFAAAALAIALCNCNRYQDLCAEANGCADGNHADFDACVAEMNKEEDIAVAHECEAEWEEYIACVEENNHCDHEDDGNELEPTDKCDDEEKDLNECIE